MSIEMLRETLERDKQYVALCEATLKAVEKMPPSVYWSTRFSSLGESLIISTTNLDDTNAARLYVGKLTGKHPELRQRWHSLGRAITAWSSKVDGMITVEVWYECPVTDYPAELQGEHCKWQAVTETDYRFVCEVKGGDA